MDDSGSPNSVDSVSEFTLAEIVEMENIYKEIEEQSLDEDFCRQLAERFNCSSNRTGKSAAITCEQVQNWFMDKHETLSVESSNSSASNFKSISDLLGSAIVSNEPKSPEKPKEEKIWKSSAILRNDKLKEPKCPEQPKEEKVRKSSEIPRSGKLDMSERIKGLHELAFEARSAKDYAWFDVAAFLSYKINHSGEPEVRVRFSGFKKEEDEWVNMRDGVRERSIPLEPSECQKVKVGDLVLCFQDQEHHAVYVDAHIAGIKRRLHGLAECTCKFIVRYQFDHSEEEVHLGRICCRPVGSDPPEEISTEKPAEIRMDENWKFSFLY